jgi:hypothetical protein
MSLKPAPQGAFIKGVDASTGLLLQSRGSIPRGSNLLLTKRGSLRTCDGSALVCAYAGAPAAGRGKIMEQFLFAPIGVSPYYLIIAKALDQPLGRPLHAGVTDAGGSGSGLSGQYYWKITALDGAVGETTTSEEVTTTLPSGHNATVTWDVVPNAVGYNVYRSLGAVPGSEQLLSTPASPITGTVPQVTPGTLTVTFTDVGASNVGQPEPPTVDTTQQTAMYATDGVTGSPLAYFNGNLVALWPADARFPDGGIPGGSGGGGGTGGGNPGTPGVSPVGTYPAGNVSFIPQMVQFVNQVCIALGNSYPPQIFRDGGGNSPDNPAVTGNVSSVSTDAYGVVTVTTAIPHGLTAQNVGACVRLQSMTDTVYNGVFVVLAVPSTTTLKIRDLAAIGHGSATGHFIITTIPIYNTFQPQFPTWVASTGYALNSAVIPITTDGDYFVAIAPAQNGISGAAEPTWPATLGATVQDGNITWQNAGPVDAAAPPPPGCSHIAVYAGALWVFDTFPANTANGLDGPTVLRMSDVNNPVSWNPVNAAFLDKDDGSEGWGLAVFTISAQGIPPQGSLLAFKFRASYQISSVFGASNFAIQRVTTDMGCISPRTIQFVPGFGIGRLTHLGVSVFDGVNDRLISPQVNPYLFPTNDPELADITVADSNWIGVAWATQTANPPMYTMFIPIGNSLGALTRALCFDLILRAWAVVDLPFPISTACQVYGITNNPLTLLGSFSDGTIQRWQAGDLHWATANGAGGAPAATPIFWSMRSAVAASKSPDERLYSRRCWVLGQCGEEQPFPIVINPRANTVPLGGQGTPMPPPSQRFVVQAAVGVTSDMFDAIIEGVGPVTIDAVGFHLEPKPLGLLVGQII